jgi:hypothetical protein
MRVRLFLALAVSLTIVLGAPYTGQLRGAIQSALPGQYRVIVGGVVAIAIAAAIAVAILRIRPRDRRPLRYGALVAAVAGGVVYATLTATGNADVDVVERFHFVEYGVLTWLFYRTWHHRADVTSLVFPVLASFMVGTLDEGFQWLVPARVGELHDVMLNGVAIACGLVFSLGLEPPVTLSRPLDRKSGRALAAFATLAIVTLAVFIQVVHLGYEVRDPAVGSFFSRYTGEQLLAASNDRAARWQTSPPNALRRMSIEDHYLAEGVWHIQRRNEGDDWTRWSENLILEKYFRPVLEFPTYSTPSGARGPPEQRDAMAAKVSTGSHSYVSSANPYPIYLWSTATFWAGVAALIVMLAAASSLRSADNQRSDESGRAAGRPV